MAPEILQDSARYSERADVYSFGVLVWFVAQHEYLAYNPEVYSSWQEHAKLMSPYKKGLLMPPLVAALCRRAGNVSNTGGVEDVRRLRMTSSMWDIMLHPMMVRKVTTKGPAQMQMRTTPETTKYSSMSLKNE